MNDYTWGDRLCRRLDEVLASETPAGLGAWPPAWEVVKEQSGALLAELLLIDRGEGDKDTAKRLGLEVLAAWRRAATDYNTMRDAA